MELLNCELVLDADGDPEAVFDLRGEQSQAIADALTFYRDSKFVALELNSAQEVLEMRALDVLSEQARTEGAHSIMRLHSAEAEILTVVIEFYVSERDVDSYQALEERQRIALLGELTVPVMQMTMDLRAAAVYAREQLVAHEHPLLVAGV
jgi:hypothetical protein